MFAVRNKITGKFLCGFSGSLNHRRRRWNTTLDELFCLDTPDGAKLYRTMGAVANSFYSYRYQTINSGRRMLPLSDALPWLEIIQVETSVKVVQ
jgi:hypothetical protein